MNLKCRSRNIWCGRCLVLLSVLTLLLLIYALNGTIWDISKPVLDTYIVQNTKFNSPNNSGQQGVTDANIHKMNSLIKSSGKRVTNVNIQKSKSMSTELPPPETTVGYSQKMNRLKTLLQRRVAEDDPKLIQLIRSEFVFIPENKPYNLRNPDVRDYSCGQSSAIDNVLNQKVIATRTSDAIEDKSGNLRTII
ncbi:hypothetical protein CHS0354_013968 [Potamilus streckersoni]|uniref:Uncharacterized protein n=1 Tax=Potamilus streckersoni TaxID=2493646 RepID=A0AAE0RWR4_9BIVA|nr:hypothetical protein CHS0354_013968 [Potamilus streckersoni]